MRKNLVLTLTGNDRVGIVESVTGLLLNFDGNIEASKMARLGGEFAMLALVSLPENQIINLESELNNLTTQGYKVTFSQTEDNQLSNFTGWLSYQIEVEGADHEGIIHEVARHLVQFGINIETADTNIVKAPMSGTNLFNMIATVAVPPTLIYEDWTEKLDEVAHRLDVDISVSRLK